MKSERQQLDIIDAKVARARSQFDQVARELTRLSEVEMDHKALTRKISAWIERAQKEAEASSETYAIDRLSTLVDDIEALCKEQTDKEP